MSGAGVPDPRVEPYLARLDAWPDETRRLRQIALGLPLNETIKWGKPCYALDGANIALIHGFKTYCAMLFFKGSLLRDDHKLLVRQTENVTAPRQMRFVSLAEVEAQAPIVFAYLQEAMANEAAGRTTEPPSPTAAPPEWTALLARDKPLRAAYAALTPGRQRAYLLHFGAAKQSATREARIARWRPHILAGKGIDD